MQNTYFNLRSSWGLIAGLIALLVLGPVRPAAAQSGPYGNEWIVPGQQYYKIKISRIGIYRLDYQYLTRAGLGNVNPSQLQLWRRGREVAIYQGGNQTVLDATSYLEFYGQRNDGKLDADYYKNPADQPHQLYSFSTDTAAYFLTYGVGAGAVPGKRVVQPVTAGGTPHPYRLLNNLKIEALHVVGVPPSASAPIYLPWLEKGEGFYSSSRSGGYATHLDTVFRAILPSPAPRLEVLVLGGNANNHTIGVQTNRMTSPTAYATVRGLGYTPVIVGYDFAVVRFPLLRSDITSAGYFGITMSNPGEFFRLGYVRVIAPQANRWFSDRRWLLFQNDSTLGGPATYELDSIPATVRGYDVQDPWNVQRIDPTAATTLGPLARRFVFPGATAQQTRWLFLADAARALIPAPPQRVQFRTINPATPNYLIITHRKLMHPAVGTTNAALEYARYRASAAGGGYDTLMLTSNQVFDQFHYGERSVLALRQFALWMAANATAARPKHLLLLGKGIQPDADIIPSGALTPTANTTRIVPDTAGIDLVPVSSRSVSDNWLSCDFRHNDYVAKLPTGRVVATTAQQVMNYLAKVKAHELPQPLQAWRKNALNIAGGESVTDFSDFGGYLDRYKQLHIEQPCFNGQVVRTYSRSTVVNANGTSLPVNINISNELNTGLSLITYFGHGSNTEFDVNLGDVNDPSNNYTNTGKYPMLFYNGCAAAQLDGNYPTFGENWLLSPDKGALALMGQTGFGYASPLHAAQDTLYDLLLNDPLWYGKPVTIVHNEVIRRLQTDVTFVTFWGDIAVEQFLATLWHGDPALKLYSPALPDFQTSAPQLSIAPATGQTVVKASSANFLLNIGVSNPGNFCIINNIDTIGIRVTRRYSTSRPPDVYTYKFKIINQTTATYTVSIPNTIVNGINVFGVNHFLVELDYRNLIPELDETNNSAQIDYTFLEDGVTILNPLEFSILKDNTPRLVAQTNDPNGPLRGYDFQVDTVATFNSSLMQHATVQATLAPIWQPTLRTIAGRDSVVWYWRVRFSTVTGDENPNWVLSSFRVITNNPGGWSQSHYTQFRRDQRQGVEVAIPGGQWSFVDQKKGLVLRTQGGGPRNAAPNFANGASFGILADVGATPVFTTCAVNSPNLLVVVYDQHSLQPKVMSGTWDVCGTPPQQFYIFAADPTSAADTLNNLNNSSYRQAQFELFLNSVADGDYVALISMNRLRWTALPNSFRQAVGGKLGSRLVAQLHNGDPFALLAQKFSAGGRLIHETGPDLTITTPPRYNQIITLTDSLRTPSTKGTVISTQIGPAQQWQTLYSWITKASPTSSYVLKIQGVDTTGVLRDLSPVYSNVVGGRTGFSLSGISARQYPYLQLQLSLSDSVNRTSPQLREWFITYKGLPEGIVRRDLVAASSYDPASLETQATTTGTIGFPVKFLNVAPIDFGTPMQAKVELLGSGIPATLVPIPNRVPGSALPAGDTLTLNVKLNIIGHFGTFTPQVTINPTSPGRPLPELFYFNNSLTLAPFTVVDHNVPPILDVAVDGRHILNGELVSPTPAIHIQLRDEDKLRHISKPSYFTVLLLRPGSTTYETVNLMASNIQFHVDSVSQPGSIATIDYQPGQAGPLKDGIYTLRVQGHDPSNASSGATDFEVKFEVVNASTITNVFPYPNPVVSKARFVFTVTGQELPHNMKIQIMTLTGAVVKEIFMGELGTLHIGNNLTDYAWDGTDQYGDRLANGTYLYRVALDDPNGQFSRRATAGDQAFKNDWGKLVLMR